MVNNLVMEETAQNASGWSQIPLPLKILFVVFALWMVGAVFNLPNLYENGMPVFGTFVYGMNATILPLFLDFVGPGTFMFAIWNRKSWAVFWVFTYNGIFILNNTVAFFTVREELGVPQILGPTIASLVFLAFIFWQRNYFKQTSRT